MHVVIVGAGWAGLAAAVELCRAAIPVTLIEAAARPGGRARRIEVAGTVSDNGQHLMMGAYGDLLELLAVIGVSEAEVLRRQPLRLEMRSPRRSVLRLDFPTLPAPWQVIAGFLRAQGLSPAQRYRALRLCAGLSRSGFQLAEDQSVAQWLRRAGQDETLISGLWEPLCLAALNTPIARASARVFVRVLHEVFAGRRSDSDMLFPYADLGAVFPEPALTFIRQRGGTVRLGERVLGLNIEDGRLRSITTRRTAVSADHAIIATAAEACLRLIAPIPRCTTPASNWRNWDMSRSARFICSILRKSAWIPKALSALILALGCLRLREENRASLPIQHSLELRLQIKTS